MVSPRRRVLTIMPDSAWLVVVGERWGVDTRHEDAVPLERSRLWLLPLLDRPREEVEAEARLYLADPDLSEPFNAMIETVLSVPSEYYVSRLVGWLKTEDILAFATDLRKVALGRSCSQATRHALKRLLNRHGVWAAHSHPAQPDRGDHPGA
ncbi:hypothetical protein [Actinoallomurus rhizosphaericola]|uniref:hypothetical protein n=1 Tax=Actinoallomurus rhizosphaericola TaxID=2952536 RepID=UPI0020927AD9|nr:hypothetical protein [Actinoallomurus rhizosphaericola]MCO5997474.1 hypothetical protein [Actinoallomurus rhizosphaericola]